MMKQRKIKAWLVILVLLICAVSGAGLGVGIAQTNSLSIGAFTIDASGSPALTVKPPTRAGTLAITADIPVAPPGPTLVAGQATLIGGVVTVNFTAINANAPICVAIDTTQASPVRRAAVTPTSVTFEGVKDHTIEYICTAKNN
jgi:hypothetical protein